jgi:hypothetical protein
MANSLGVADNGGVKSMNWGLGLYESFCDLLDTIPTKAVLRAVEAERRMVEDDLNHKRTERNVDVISVLSFCNFLRRVDCAIDVSMPDLPPEHHAFYGRVVQRLVEAGELPSESTVQFNRCFAPAFGTTQTRSTC